MQQFTKLGLSESVSLSLKNLGFSSPTDIQSLTIPVILKKEDAYISAATGTGKTFAYMAPIVSSILTEPSGKNRLRAIIISPTYDLAAQIDREANKLSRSLGIVVVPLLGSIPMKRQLQYLAEKPHIAIGSLGRVRDLIYNKYIDISSCSWCIMDEADKLFENEAIDITKEILDELPETCSRVLVSASIPKKTRQRSEPWFRKPVDISIDHSLSLKNNITHFSLYARLRNKLDIIRRFDAAVKPSRAILFASSNASIFNIQKKLDFLKFDAIFLNSNDNNTDRKNALHDFEQGKARWLISTDLAARGLDIADVSHIVHFDLPEDPNSYLHRSGRTGRAGKHGYSVIIADAFELKRASKLAVRYGFNFKCKVLYQGALCDISTDDFFAQVAND